MARPRNLVVGFDGTWNEPEPAADGSSCDTNVVKFLRALRSNNGQQLQHYEQGVGSRAWEIVRGGIRRAPPCRRATRTATPSG